MARSDHTSGPSFKADMQDTFDICSELMQNAAYNKCFKNPGKVSLIEFIEISVLIGTLRKKLMMKQLGSAIEALRSGLREKRKRRVESDDEDEDEEMDADEGEGEDSEGEDGQPSYEPIECFGHACVDLTINSQSKYDFYDFE
ncbi:hypothetical protein BKA70DRAFT_1532491 [Coprinopsis sp. MPI-PUGE-AT-0042]|nr:hypothetical protein BKA70DRAFT_1532491 [Coprinopsis sp. MPI-PUGE-AT-0042]